VGEASKAYMPSVLAVWVRVRQQCSTAPSGGWVGGSMSNSYDVFNVWHGDKSRGKPVCSE